MAFNFRSLGVRSLSAFFFVALLLGSVLWNYPSFTIFFFVVSLIGLHEFNNMATRMGFFPLKAVGYICAVIMSLLFIRTGLFYGASSCDLSYLAAALPVIICGAAIFSSSPEPITGAMVTVFGLVYCVLPFGLMHYLVVSNVDGSYVPATLLGVILLIWSNDTFAYLVGNLAGKHKMIERISPGKTWEGTIGGIVITFGLSFVVGDLVGSDKKNLWPILGIVVPILATMGDLVQSQLKRRAGVKDSGNIMPGHGGVLDRFDSLIFVIPFVFVIVALLQLN